MSISEGGHWCWVTRPGSQSAFLIHFEAGRWENRLLWPGFVPRVLCWNRKRPPRDKEHITVQIWLCCVALTQPKLCKTDQRQNFMLFASRNTRLVIPQSRTWFQWDNEQEQSGEDLGRKTKQKKTERFVCNYIVTILQETTHFIQHNPSLPSSCTFSHC